MPIDHNKNIEVLFRGRRIVIVGDLVADQFLSGSISRVSREAPVFILRHETTETRPGGAANAAANVASLGGVPVAIGLIGDDLNGRLLRESLEHAGVDCGSVITTPGRATTTKVRVLAGQSYSVKQQVIRIDYENDADIPGEVSSQLIEQLRTCATDADAIVVSDYGCGMVSNEMFSEALSAAKQHSVPLIVDSRFRLADFHGATSATPNQEEVQQLIGPGFGDDDCVRLKDRLGLDSLVVTCGNKGMIVVDDRSTVSRIPAVGSAEPVDVTGAGDTVIAAYSLGLAAGLAPRDAASLANHAGGVVVMKKGTATVSIKEMLESLDAHEGLTRSDAAV